MNTLFDITPQLPPGFSYRPNFISIEEEENLLQLILAMPLETMKFHQYEAKRKVAGFGKGWSFTDQQIKDGRQIPQGFIFLRNRIAGELKIAPENFVQLLVTEYPVGAVINWHRDAPPFEIVAGVSLAAACTFKLRPHDKDAQTRAATIALNVEPRSLYSMQKEAKTQWQHCTAPLKKVRYSLTFRTLKNV